MQIDYRDIGNRIRAERMKQKISQEKLAEMLDAWYSHCLMCCVLFRSRNKTSERLNVVDSIIHNISSPYPHFADITPTVSTHY